MIIFLYSLCHYLKGVKDALSEYFGLVWTVGQYAKTWWWERQAQSASQHIMLAGQVTVLYHTILVSRVC